MLFYFRNLSQNQAKYRILAEIPGEQPEEEPRVAVFFLFLQV